MDNYMQGWKRAFDFQGRSARSEYWTFVLVNFVAFMGLFLVAAVTSSADSISPVFFVAWAMNLAALVPSLSAGVRRLHDTGKSGMWMLTLFIPFLNAIAAVALLVMFCMDSQPHANKFGPSPKGGFDGANTSGEGMSNAFSRPVADEGESTEFAKSA